MVISEVEKELLVFLSDREQHDDKPDSLSNANFVFAARTLSEKGLVRAAFVEGGDVECIQITKIGMAIIENIQNQNLEGNKAANKTSIVSNDELNMLFDQCLIKIPFFRGLGFSDKIWDDCLPYLDRLVSHNSPALYISTIKNELRVLSGEKKPSSWDYAVKLSSIIALQLYVILYYRFRDCDIYKNNVLLSLKEVLGFFDSHRCKFSAEVLPWLQKLPIYSEGLTEQHKATPDNNKVQILEAKIKELTADKNALSEENTNLRAEITTLKSQNIEDPIDEQVIIETGQSNQIKQHKISARQIAQLIKDANKLSVMQQQEWEDLLSKITGLSSTTFHKYLR